MIVTVEVPSHLDINASLDGAEAAAQHVIEAGRQWAHRGQRVHGAMVRVRPGEAGHRIVREAQQAHADAIVMAMPRHRPSGRLLNKTLEVVLAKRPCRVIIESQNGARPDLSAGDAAGLNGVGEPIEVG